MTKVTVDAELRAKLHNFDGLLEVCDEAGRVLGYFHPVDQLEANGRAGSPISDEEIERCRQQKTGRPLAEIMADLERQS